MRGIILIIVGAMMVAFPSLMSSVMGTMIDTGSTVASSGHLSDLSNNVANQMQSSIMPLMSAISYIAGIGLTMRGILLIKEDMEGGSSYSKSSYTPPKQEEKKVEAPKEEIKKPVIEKPILNPLDMEDKDLNAKVKIIIDKINILLTKELVQKDIQNKMLLTQTKDEYLPKIAKHYTTIPKEMRNKSVQGHLTANDMAHKQLDLILEAVQEVEDNVLNEQTKEMRVMERFLKNKFDLEEESIIDFDKIQKSVEHDSEKELNSN